jgi:hypothetical protein
MYAFEYHRPKTVADFAGPCALNNRFYYLIKAVIGNCNLDFCFRQEIHDIFRAAIELGMAALPAKSLHLTNRHAVDSDLA